ncbi:RHS repeat-associated core domain-containing protein [Pseudoalteromonas sp. DSM 26666]|uniref:RHS repeat-associated core domain-containing protein n=2 Tax=unclassified Pseudoalteromonas TaxID=194690 RepID=UPI0008F1A977|nr:RHS repeat-associated core domain-containing protein [Pseudoalteromonas sp. DSM 26666]SFT61987.1 RHS repeat-associated core domain-containing protein [Pseudoalteromonas sp. DSM 26666]
MQSNTVVLQGISYPICLVAGKGSAPSGFVAVAANTPESAKNQIAQIGSALTSDAAKRLDVINLLNLAGVSCSRGASARETASVLTQALVADKISCYHQKAKSAIQVSDNTNSGAAGKKPSSKSSSTASGKSASQAPAKNSGGASNNTPSEEPITKQECRSDPVSMLSGEEILPLIDFTLAGSKQLIWRRLYRSSHADVCSVMGNGWRHDFMVQLTEHYLPPPKVGPKQKGTYWLEYQDEHGAKHRFEKVKPGQSSYQLSSNLALHYQTNGKQVLVTPDDQHLTFKAGENSWLLEKVINEKGQSIGFYYDAKERLHRVEVNKARGCILKYNPQGLLANISAYRTGDNNKPVLLTPLLAQYDYDENKNLVRATNQQGETEHYGYNAANLLTKRTRASGFSHHFEWDSYSSSAKCIKQWGDNNTYTYQFEYNLDAGETTCIDSRGHKEHFVHNAQGKLVKHTDPNGNVWQYSYNAQGQKVTEIKPDSSEIKYSYTPYGQLESITQPDGSVTKFAYNQLGQRVLTTLPDGQTITRKYSVAGLLQSETFGDGRTVLYSYDKFGQLTQHINKDGQVTKFVWNEQGELLAKHYNDELIRYSYDSLGRVNATINNAGLLTQYKYNEHGQLAQTIAFDEKDPENKQHQHFSYDDAGRLISSQNSKGDTTEQHFEGLSQPHCVIQPDGSALHLTYDKERNLTAIERSDGHVYRISYDANENPTQVTGFDGTLQQYKYDACNRLTSVTQSDKRHVKIERDKLGRVIAQHASLATDTHIVNNANYYNYNLQGKITRAHNAQSTLKQQFDKGGRLLRAEQVHNQQQVHTLKYSYDDYGRRQSLTLPDSSTLKYSYNKFGQLSAIHLQQANSTAVELAALSYDSQGNIQTQKFGNDVTLIQQFDVFNRLTQQQLTHPAQALFDTCKYNYDSVNQLIARKEEGVSSHNINFEYNSLGQLIQQNLASGENTKTTQYQWDSFGNPVSQSKIKNNELAEQQTTQHNDESDAINKVESNQSANTPSVIQSEYSDSKSATLASDLSEDDRVIKGTTDADRLIHFGDSDFHYDEFGNQIRETGKGIKTRREYNAFNQLSCFNNNGTLTQYDYDPLGRRIAKHTEQGKIDYIWDNDQLIGEYQHGEYTWYINLPNQFHPVALIKQGEVYYYHLDQLNTPCFVTNNKAEVVWENQADVYGYEELKQEHEADTKNSFTQPIRFQGQYLDIESGLHYNRYRYYSPKQQRFINQDPIGLVGGINHYQYAPNPVNWVDPFGLMCKEGQAKVKVALDAKPEISGDLRSQIENICKQEQSGCTADEMVEQINAFDAVTGGLDLFVSGLLNSVVDVVAGGAGIVTLAMSGGDIDAAVHTIESVQSNQIGPFTDAGQAVSEKLAPIVQEYYEDNMAALGDATLEATGSPALATMAHKSVEIAATLAGGKTVLNGTKGAKNALKASNNEPNIISGSGSDVHMDGHKIYDSNFPALSTNPSAQYRFSDPTYRPTGEDVYFGENVVTSYVEVRKNLDGKSLFVGDVRVDNILDLTDPNVLKKMSIDPAKLAAKVDNPVQQKTIYGYTNQISNQAFDAGYNGILYPSSRKNGNNRAITLFGGRYDSDAITLILDRKISP